MTVRRESDIKEAGVLFTLSLSLYFTLMFERVITLITIMTGRQDSTNEYIEIFITVALVVATLTLYYLRIVEYKWMGEVNVCILNVAHLLADLIIVVLCVSTGMLNYKYFWFYLVLITVAYGYDAWVNIASVIIPKLIRGNVSRLHCYTHSSYDRCCKC